MMEMFEWEIDTGVERIVIRLNVLGNVIRKSLRQIFSEFSGGMKPVSKVVGS